MGVARGVWEFGVVIRRSAAWERKKRVAGVAWFICDRAIDRASGAFACLRDVAQGMGLALFGSVSRIECRNGATTSGRGVGNLASSAKRFDAVPRIA